VTSYKGPLSSFSLTFQTAS